MESLSQSCMSVARETLDKHVYPRNSFAFV